MATAKDYFAQSQPHQCLISMQISEDESNIEISVQIALDYEGGSKFLKIYIPESPDPELLLYGLLLQMDELIWKHETEIEVKQGEPGTREWITSRELRFSGRVLVYTPTIIDDSRWNALKTEMTQKGLNLLLRDGAYAKSRSDHDKPLAFISHDSRDKDAFVTDLVRELSIRLCPVWYDEYRLKPGDSLREQIESGLKSCRRCIVILSKNFFSNPGWTKKEFDSIYTREIIKAENVIIPVWLDVTKDDVFDYSPSLADRLGIPASLGAEEVASRLVRVLKP